MLRALAESPLESVPRLEAQMLADEEVCTPCAWRFFRQPDPRHGKCLPCFPPPTHPFPLGREMRSFCHRH